MALTDAFALVPVPAPISKAERQSGSQSLQLGMQKVRDARANSGYEGSYSC